MADNHPGVLLPWQSAQWARFQQARAADRMPHALLLAGPRGTGKGQLAEAIAARLLCEHPDADRACGSCRGCHLLAAGSHPDFRRIMPEEGGSGILRIEPIRDLAEFSQRTSQFNAARVALLSPAEALNRAAANALLKTLEEPPPGMCLILVSHETTRLPATVRSRCQTYRMGLPSRQAATQWLADEGIEGGDRLLDLAGGAPLFARALAAEEGLARHQALADDLCGVLEGHQDPVERAAHWQTTGATELARMMQRLTVRIARAHVTGGADRPEPAIKRLAGHLPAPALHALNARLTRLRAAGEQPLSRELAPEALFLLWRNPDDC